VVDPKAALPRNRLRQRRNGAFVEIFDGAAGGADQVVMMSRLAPDISRYMTGTLQSLREAGAHQSVQGAEHGRPPDVGVLPADPLVELLRGGLFAGLGQHAGDGEPLRRQPDAGLLESGLGGCLNHSQMILRRLPRTARYPAMASAVAPSRPASLTFFQMAGAGFILLPALTFGWLVTHPPIDLSIRIPLQHFYIVTAVSLLAFGLAVLLAIAAMQIAQYRVLFLCLGFMAMGGIFAVHGLMTPGIVGDADDVAYAGAIVGISAYLSLFVPALFFAASYTPLTAAFELRLPFSPAGWLIVVLATALGIYAGLALLSGEVLALLPFGTKPYSYGMAGTTIVLLLFAAGRQARAYLTSRLPLQGILVVVFLLLAEAQMVMVLGTVWKLSWWEYHGLMLVGVGLAFWSMAAQRTKGQSLRSLVEATLELEVKVGTELEHVDTIAALAAAVEARDENTRGHNLRVAELAVQIGRAMELPNDTLRTLARAGLLHDVGKIGIPDSILSKPGPLDPQEWVVIKRHPELGQAILSRVDRLRREAEIVIAHHERLDGSGYPRGLRGDQIPLEARILAVADTYDVLVSDRPYRKAFDKERGFRILREECGTHLWEPAVRALFRSLGERWDDRPATSSRAA